MTSPSDLCSSFFSPIVSVTPDLVMSGRLLELSRVLVPFVKPCRVAPCREADAGSVIQDLGNRQQSRRKVFLVLSPGATFLAAFVACCGMLGISLTRSTEDTCCGCSS
ncbi:General negative regulator of transcription subunit 4 [Fusarium oxysporum f. sp. albedinis]|nr:General negative regulator of transcription subunit 4 [Fusarium oxysporum f. sp. albedinis]